MPCGSTASSAGSLLIFVGADRWASWAASGRGTAIVVGRSIRSLAITMGADVVSAIGTVAAAIVSVVAVVVAARSAGAAERSADAAAATLRRSAVRELIGLCHEVTAEELRIHDLGASLRSAYTTLFVLSGASGGSRETTLKATLDEDLKASTDLAGEATTLGDDLAKLHAASNDDVDQMSTRLLKARTRLRAIRESIELQLSETRTSISDRQTERK